MTNKTEMVSVPRELLEAVSKPLETEKDLKERVSARNEIRSLLVEDHSDFSIMQLERMSQAAPAEDVRAVGDEPVATVVTIKKQSMHMMINGIFQPSITSEEKVAVFSVDLPAGAKLYRHPQRRLEMAPRAMKGRKAEKGSTLAMARLAAHKAFDAKWQSGSMSRSAAYRWLAKEMGMTRDECHMFQMLEEECREVVRICTVDSFEDLTR